MNEKDIDSLTENRPIKAEEHLKHGYVPDFIERTYRIFARFMIFLLRLKGESRYSNIFIQLLNPVFKVKWDMSKSLWFRTGHGRLLWRARTFFSEEPMMIDWIKKFTQNDVFLDIGANVGMYTIPGAYMAGIAYACELDPINIGILKENIHLNGLHNKIIILPFAAGESSKIVRVYYRDFSKGDALQSIERETVLNTFEGEGKHISLQLSFSIDKIFQDFELQQPTRIKIDVDGNEMVVFRGGAKTIFSADEIYFEDSGLRDCGQIIEEILGNGYKVLNTEIPAGSKGGRNIIFKKDKHKFEPDYSQ